MSVPTATRRVPYVVARDANAIDRAIDAARSSVRAVSAESGVSRATIYNLASTPGYGIAKDKAERIAKAVGQPVGDIFIHRDGAALT